MLRKASQLFQRQGFHGSGLKQILEESGAPRGSLYFHFPGGKEQLAAEAVREAGERTSRLVQALFDAGDDPAAAVRTFFLALSNQLETSDFQDGCPIATITLEAAATSAPIREASAASFAQWQQHITDRLNRAGMEAGESASIATLILAAAEGALILSRAHRDTQPLAVVAAELEALIKAALKR